MEDKHRQQFKKLGLNIAYARKEIGLSQMELANRAGISRTHMSRIENSDCAVSLDTLFDIADVLGISAKRLFDFRE